MLKIICLTKWYPNEDNFISGIFVHEFAKSISKICRVRVLHILNSDYNLIKRNYIKDNVRIYQIHYRCKFVSCFIYNILTIAYLIRLIKKDAPDLIHVHVFSAAVPAIIVKRFFRIPFVVTEHYEISDISLGHAYPNKKKISLKLRSILARYIFTRADALINVSKYMENEIRDLGVQTPSYIIPNVVDHNTFYFDKRKIIQRNIRHILFVGALGLRKGVELVFQAVESLRQCRCDFVIEIIGNGDMKAFYMKKAQQMDISKYVRFHGSKRKQEIADFMRNSDFLILPSYWENFPCVILESLCCGLPVISTNVGGIPEIINESNGILISPGEPELLVEAMKEMLDTCHKYDREVISNNAIELYSHSIGKRLFDIYNRLVTPEDHINGKAATTEQIRST